MSRTGLIGIGLALASCGGSSDREAQVDESDRLYRETVRIARTYSDSIRMGADSAAVEDAFLRANLLIDSLNFSVAPDTDLLLTEAENDTIIKCLSRLVDTYHTRLADLGARQAEPDTIPSSSLDN